MKKIYILLTLISISLTATAVSYEKNNSILNMKYGFKLGDLIEVQDKIITETNFIKTPELIIKKNNNLKLIDQTNSISLEADKYVFTNKIIYQIYQKSVSGSFLLPIHNYKINNENIAMPKKLYWFTRVAESKLNNILLNSIEQEKPRLNKVKTKYFNVLCGFIFLTSLILLYKNIDIPLLSRMNGPFAKAHKKIKILNTMRSRERLRFLLIFLQLRFTRQRHFLQK